MKRRHALAVIGLLPFLAHAQRPFTPDWVTEMRNAQANAPDWLKEQQQVFARNAIRADGETNPASIPFAVAAETAFFRFADEVGHADTFRLKLQQNFGPSEVDLKRITELAAVAHAFAEEVRNEEARSYDAACAKVVSAEPWNSVDAVEVAREFQNIENKRMELIARHYRAAIDELSAPVRSALLSYIDTNIRPQLRWSTLDNVGIATEIPDDWLYNKRLICQNWLSLPISQRTWRV